MAAGSDPRSTPFEPPGAGRRYHGRHRVRLGEVDPRGRLRLDAVARCLQDVANDDAHDSGIDDPGGWVLRHTTIEVQRSPVLREDLELVTFCSGTGRCWAERRTSVRGAAGGRVEAVALWVHIDLDSGRPLRLGADFHRAYGEAAAGRVVKPSHRLDASPPADAEVRRFTLRRADLDVIGHVNNAVYWAMVEELIAPHERRRGRYELEHLHPIEAGAGVELLSAGDQLWVCSAGRAVAVGRRGPAVPLDW